MDTTQQMQQLFEMLQAMQKANADSGNAATWAIVLSVTIPLLVGGVGAIWQALSASKIKRIDNDQKTKEVSLDVERERIKSDFERQKKFMDDQQKLLGELVQERKDTQAAYKSMCEENLKLQEALMMRTQTIRERDEKIAELERKVETMQAKIDQLTRHVQELEEKDRQRDAA